MFTKGCMIAIVWVAIMQPKQNKLNSLIYADKVDRAEFIEALRERLIFLRELLSEDGSVYVHLDQKWINAQLVKQIYHINHYITNFAFYGKYLLVW
ncbi:MAG: hypothetical protein U9N60_08430 [Thermodesulfobacteriota bacterium]|nr:hypothetical protein [Thermodesulfobacteriota bacterium]